MSRFTELLDLPATTVKDLAKTYAGYAKVMESESDGNPDRQLIAASSWLIGALFQSLIEPVNAKQLFVQAARAYKSQNLPIWRVCALCAGDKELPVHPKLPMLKPSEEELFYITLQESLNEGANVTYDHITVGEEFRGNIPGLGIPYRLVLKALEEVKSDGFKIQARPMKNVADVLQRLSEIIEQYKADEHWKNLEGPILPFEPVALAIMVVVLTIWKQNHRLTDFYDGHEANTKALIGIAQALIDDHQEGELNVK